MVASGLTTSQSVHVRLRPLKWAAAIAVWAGLWWIARPGPSWPGIIAAVLGQSIQLWAAGALPRTKGDRLVSDGPYAIVRNPMYIGRFLVGLGLALLTWQPGLIVAFLLLFPLYAHFRVHREERRLQEAWGEEYDRYCRRVPRWVPRWPHGAIPRAGWTLAGAHRYGQIAMTVALVAIVASLAVRQARL